MLVFGILRKLPGAVFRGSMAERANIIRECIERVVQLKAQQVLRDSIRKHNVPSVAELEKVRRTEPGSKVLVFREKESWRKYTLVRLRQNDIGVISPSGRISTFPLNVIRPYMTDPD